MKTLIKVNLLTIILFNIFLLPIYCKEREVQSVEFYYSSSGSLQWNGSHDPDEIYCFPEGQGCMIVVTIIYIGEPVVDDGDIWRTSIRFGSVEFNINSETYSGTIEKSANNFVFPQGSTLEIIKCTDYPNMVGRTINISGMITSPTGWLDISIPLNN